MLEWLSNPQNAGAVSVIFAGLTAIATLAAAATALLGPYISARLQRKHTKDMAERDTKLRIFGVLMCYRQNWGQREPVQALNLIDIAWIDHPAVRRAWHEFYNTVRSDSAYSLSEQQDAYKRMLERMAEDLGFAGDFRADDYARVFYSNAVHWEEQARLRHHLQTLFPDGAGPKALGEQAPISVEVPSHVPKAESGLA